MKAKSKKIAAWAGGVVAILILLMVMVATLIQQNTWVHRYLLAKAIQAGENSTGALISIENFRIRWVPLQITLNDVVVRSRQETSTAPLAKLPQVYIGMSWHALVRKRIDLTELILERPEINLLIHNTGESNLPKRPTSSTASSSSKLQISIRHAAVREGELRYNNVPQNFDADLADFHAEVTQNTATDQYTGTLAYGKGLIAIDGYAPFRHDAQIDFAATAKGVTFQRIHVATESSQLTAKGSMQDFSRPLVEGQYEIVLSAADLRQQIAGLPIASGEIELAGSLEYSSAVGSGLEALKTSGHVFSKTLTAVISASEVEVQSIAGDYSLDRGNLRMIPLRADVFGGVLRAEFSAADLAATPRYQASLSVRSLSLGQAEQIAGVNVVPLRGTAGLEANAKWVSSLQTLVAQAQASISAVLIPTRAAEAQEQATPVPLNAMLHLSYDAPRGTLEIENSTVGSEKTTVTANGTVSDHSVLTVRARSSDLQETDLLILALRKVMNSTGTTPTAERVASPAVALNLHGTASLEAQVRGRIQHPRITGHAQADALQIRQTSWPHLQADFEASATSLSVTNGVAQTRNRGQLNFSLATQLQQWSYATADPVTVEVQATQVPLGDLEQVTGLSEPVSGMLSANVSLHGTVDNPAGAGSVELHQAAAWGQPIQAMAAKFEAADRTVSANFSITADPGTVSGSGEFDAKDGGYRLSINHSELNVAKIHYLSSSGYNAAGTVTVEAQGQGTLKAPQLELAIASHQLAFRNTDLGSINAQLQVANRQAKFALTSNIAGGQIDANGNTALAAPYDTQAAFEIRSLNFGPLLAGYAPWAGKQLQGNTEVRGQIEGPLARPQELKATVDLSALKLAYQNFSLASAGPVHINYADSVLTIPPAELKGTDTDFKLGGTVPLRGSAPLNISTTGLIDLRLLAVLGGNTQSSGTLKIDMTARGALKSPDLAGTLELAKASYSSDTAPIGVEDVNGRIAVANKRLTVEALSGQMGGGTFSVGGSATYAPVSYSLQVKGESVRIRYPQGTRAQLDAGLTLTGNAANSALNGRVTIDQLSFTPNFDLADFVAQFSSSPTSVPSKWGQNTHLNVAVASGDELALSSSQLSLQGSVNLRVAGTLANPVVLGRTTLTGGSVIFMGNVYQVQSGTVGFANPIRTEPSLNLFVTTSVEDYNITLNFVGTPDRLRTNYTSDPALPPVDIIHLLAFGKTTAEAGATPAALGAQSVIANGLASQVSNQIEKLTGISQLQIDPSLGTNNSDPGARLAIQQRVTSSILFTFATDLTNTQNEVIQVRYQTKGKLSFSVTRDENGSYAIQVNAHKTF